MLMSDSTTTDDRPYRSNTDEELRNVVEGPEAVADIRSRCWSLLSHDVWRWSCRLATIARRPITGGSWWR